MPASYVLINTEIGYEDAIVKRLRETPHIVESYVVYGVYDIIAKVEAETMEEIKDIITSRIRRLEKVRSTLTMIMISGK
ncbi:MAG: Lrp/AsnC ligand binding domain-containing protein [Candidatus Bathyarchaeota archaeon]|nr:Lrp/AsnC ligand binding domain-containing protein [Candidatus Bathyarchaeota archaeon]